MHPSCHGFAAEQALQQSHAGASPLALFGLLCLTPPPPGASRRGRLLARCSVMTSCVSRGTQAYAADKQQEQRSWQRSNQIGVLLCCFQI